MRIFNNKKIYIFFGIVLTLLITGSLYYFAYVNNKKAKMQADYYGNEAKKMQQLVSQKIDKQQKEITAIAFALSRNSKVVNEMKTKNVDDAYCKNLVQELKNITKYKNIWINIVDSNCTDICRSWTKKKGDNLADVRKDLVAVIQTKKIISTISSGPISFNIKGIIPVMENNRTLGTFEIITHFNLIKTGLKKLKIESLVLLDKQHSQKIRHPFLKNFLDGHYVATFNPSKSKLEYLHKYGVSNYFKNGYRHENGYLIVSYPLKSYNNKVIGYYIMFKADKDIFDPGNELISFKWMAFGLLTIFIILIIVLVVYYLIVTKQKNYLKKIIDSSTNIIFINDTKEILDTNATFFKYFTNEENLDEFKKKYSCVCNLFVKEKGYLQAEMDEGITWIEYLLQHPQKTHHIAKIKYNGKVYYFTVSVSLISEEKHHYGIIMSNVTKEEEYKLELEKLSTTDSLTGIYNRRYFDTKLKEKIKLAQRYNFTFSLIMFDIDHFKKINDKYGHDVGDRVLVEYTKLISELIREGDIFCRVGGEEFMIIVPYTDGEKAKKIAEKLRSKVENYKKVVPISISFGVSEYIQGETSDHIYKRVDDALYEAKENGRNQVVFR